MSESDRASVYVASSWRNSYQPAAVEAIREAGLDVYDFRDDDGFNWREVDPDHDDWDFGGWMAGLSHEAAERGFKRDMCALDDADYCVLVLPCGRSAHLEAGYAIGQLKPTAIWVPEYDAPDLMVKMADFVTDSLDGLMVWFDWLRGRRKP